MVGGRNESSSSTASSDFFSPISITFFQNRNNNNNTNNTNSVERLPPLHDGSWIGARLSPIRSFDREAAADDDDDDDTTTTTTNDEEKQRHRALHDTLQAAPFVLQHEGGVGGSKLIIKDDNNNIILRGGNDNDHNNFANTRIHPLWNSPSRLHHNSRRNGFGYITTGNVLCGISGLCLATAGAFDLYFQYRIKDNNVNHAWGLPWLTPSRETLIRFGALEPVRGYDAQYYLTRNCIGMFTSLLICTSIIEWILVSSAWRLLHISSKRTMIPTPEKQITGIYIASSVAGLLWMWNFDTTRNIITGSLSWGTCGVLCAAGMARPQHRFELFVFAAIILIFSLFARPFQSVYGCTSGAFLGWALGAMGYGEKRLVTLLGTGFSVLILSIPVLSAALYS